MRRTRGGQVSRGWIARVYGGYIFHGKPRRIGFQVKIGDRLSPKAASNYIASVMRRINQCQIPLHKHNETISSFHELMKRPWVNVQRITTSEADVNS